MPVESKLYSVTLQVHSTNVNRVLEIELLGGRIEKMVSYAVIAACDAFPFVLPNEKEREEAIRIKKTRR